MGDAQTQQLSLKRILRRNGVKNKISRASLDRYVEQRRSKLDFCMVKFDHLGTFELTVMPGRPCAVERVRV